MDPYGNWQDGWSTWNWNVDAQAPVVSVTSWATTHYTAAPPVVTWEANEPGVTFKCAVDGNGPAVPCSSPWQAPEFPAGASHSVTIYATDPYGNHAAPKGAKWFVTEPEPTTVAPITPVTPEQPPATTATATTAPAVTPAAGPCAPRVTVLTPSQRTIRTRGMRVRLAGPAGRLCVVELLLKAGRKVLAKQVRPVAAGQTITITLRPKPRAPRGVRIRLVSRAR
jgi:antitoxin (DNA-binding transcriptional repressor) of toxin-antitoxin stability system